METFTKAQFWAELDTAGEHVVRERVIGKVYGAGNSKLALAEEWLRVREVARADAQAQAAHNVALENLRTAKSAKNAAWVAAASAVVAIISSLVAFFAAKGSGG